MNKDLLNKIMEILDENVSFGNRPTVFKKLRELLYGAGVVDQKYDACASVRYVLKFNNEFYLKPNGGFTKSLELARKFDNFRDSSGFASNLEFITGIKLVPKQVSIIIKEI